MDATDTGVGDYGDLDRHGNYELRRVLNEERCRQFRRHLFLLSLRQIFKAYSIDSVFEIYTDCTTLDFELFEKKFA